MTNNSASSLRYWARKSGCKVVPIEPDEGEGLEPLYQITHPSIGLIGEPAPLCDTLAELRMRSR
jgi:hypothetical protein